MASAAACDMLGMTWLAPVRPSVPAQGRHGLPVRPVPRFVLHRQIPMVRGSTAGRIERVNDEEWERYCANWELRLGESLTDEEKGIFRLFLSGGISVTDIAERVGLSVETVWECVDGLFFRLQVATDPPGRDPSPDLPPAAAAALAVPIPMDIPKHVGRPLRRRPSERD